MYKEVSFDWEILYVTSSKCPGIDMIAVWLSNNVKKNTARLNEVCFIFNAKWLHKRNLEKRLTVFPVSWINFRNVLSLFLFLFHFTWRLLLKWPGVGSMKLACSTICLHEIMQSTRTKYYETFLCAAWLSLARCQLQELLALLFSGHRGRI